MLKVLTSGVQVVYKLLKVLTTFGLCGPWPTAGGWAELLKVVKTFNNFGRVVKVLTTFNNF